MLFSQKYLNSRRHKKSRLNLKSSGLGYAQGRYIYIKTIPAIKWGGGYANTIYFYFVPSTFDPSCSRRATSYNPTKNWLKSSANYAKTCPEFFGWPKNCFERVCGIEKPGKICERKKKIHNFFSIFLIVIFLYLSPSTSSTAGFLKCVRSIDCLQRDI